MAKKTKVTSAEDLAATLLDVRKKKNELAALDKKITAELKARIQEGEEQTIYTITKALSLAVADETVAFAWAMEHDAVKIDLPTVDKLLKRERWGVPEGFALKETERLVEAKEKAEDDDFYLVGGAYVENEKE